MTRPTLTDAERWTPDALREAADAWDAAATDVHAQVEIAVQGVDASREFWTGSAAQAARRHALDVGRASDAVARATVMAAVAARDGADQIVLAQADVLARVADARADGFWSATTALSSHRLPRRCSSRCPAVTARWPVTCLRCGPPS